MSSLRTRKSAIPNSSNGGGGERTPSTSKLSKPTKDVSKSRVDDRITKRLSTRYADISAPISLNAPTVPSLPAALRHGTGLGLGVDLGG